MHLKERAGNATPPQIEILDIRHRKLEEGLSAQLIQRMREHLKNNAQVMLFLNRRGYAPVLMCFDCGKVFDCKSCDARLTVHYRERKLKCHHCEASLNLPTECPDCKSQTLKPLGIGTERLETVLKKHFPEETILRLDRDTTRKKGSLEAALEKIHSLEAKIILGTQMIAKGHHFPSLSLVAILECDSALFSSDFRSIERLGQLLTQVAGRAGREERRGSVLIQTCHPEHPALKTLIEQGYNEFANGLLEERRKADLPPFSYQILLRAESKNPERALKFLKFLKSQTLNFEKNRHSNEKSQHSKPKLEILGPIPAPMIRKSGQTRAQLLIQSGSRNQLQLLLNDLIPHAETSPLIRGLKWSLDVDPVEMV